MVLLGKGAGRGGGIEGVHYCTIAVSPSKVNRLKDVILPVEIPIKR